MISSEKLAKRVQAIVGKDGADTQNTKAQKVLRDNLVYEIATISDRVCSLHQATIIANDNVWNVSTGTLTNLFSAVGTVAGGEATKAGLAAAASLTGSARSLVNEQIYAETVGTAIVKGVSVAREKYFAELKLNLQEDYEKYTVQQALRDVQEYHRRCSFYYGVVEISRSLDQRKKTKAEIDGDIDAMQKNINKYAPDLGKDPDIEEEIKQMILKRKYALE
ncbi:MAG: hypothetical protein HOF59_11530 [Gammaproteobacteria bacterium]|nr:hypothetical protein [Gammaproteobacteria bacterium]